MLVPGVQRPIGLIRVKTCGSTYSAVNIICPRVIKSHWVNPVKNICEGTLSSKLCCTKGHKGLLG